MRATAYIFACLFVGSLLPAPIGAFDQGLSVIVHPSRTAKLTRSDLRGIYLKQKLFWDDGEPIVAINREAGSTIRETFSEAILGQSTRQLASYWNQRYFEAGEFPPPTLASEEAVLRFVATNPSAIAYVSTESADSSVRVLLTIK
jgi:ABC-type phosphate transport system substrate-binding protein